MAKTKVRKTSSENNKGTGGYATDNTPRYYGSEESYRAKARRLHSSCVWDDDCGSCPYFNDCSLW